MVRAGSCDGLYGDGSIECGQPSIVPDSQAEQVDVGDLLMARDHADSEELLIQQ
jgi:hypothetical protein